MSVFPFLIVVTAIAGFIGFVDLANEVSRLLFAAWPQEVAGPLVQQYAPAPGDTWLGIRLGREELNLVLRRHDQRGSAAVSDRLRPNAGPQNRSRKAGAGEGRTRVFSVRG
jgi:hypothetical protein